jgi:hypothetical protein
MDEDPPLALSASPSLSVTATATVNSLRHSGQSRFSAMMQIQGHTVKVNGITYVFDEHQEYDPHKNQDNFLVVSWTQTRIQTQRIQNKKAQLL